MDVDFVLFEEAGSSYSCFASHSVPVPPGATAGTALEVLNEQVLGLNRYGSVKAYEVRGLLVRVMHI